VAVAHVLRIVEDRPAPVILGARQRAGDGRPEGVVDRREERDRLVTVDHPHRAARFHRRQPGDLAALDLEGSVQAGKAVAEALVDRALRRPQDRDGLLTLAGVVDEPAHHSAEDPAAPVRRADPDDRDPGRCDLGATGHGHRERERAAGPHGRVAVEGADDPVGLEDLGEILELGVGELLAEGQRERAHDRAERIGRGPADLDLAGAARPVDGVLHAVIVP
jgi:hypothetical protein